MAYSWLPPWCRCCYETHLTDEETEAQRWQNLPEGPQLLSIPCQNLAPEPTLYQWTIQPPNSPCKEKIATSRQKRKFLFCLGIAVVSRLISSMDLLLAQQHFQGNHWGGCPTQREIIVNSQVMSVCVTVAFCLWFFPSFSLCWPPPAFLFFLLLFISFSLSDSFSSSIAQCTPLITWEIHFKKKTELKFYKQIHFGRGGWEEIYLCLWRDYTGGAEAGARSGEMQPSKPEWACSQLDTCVIYYFIFSIMSFEFPES